MEKYREYHFVYENDYSYFDECFIFHFSRLSLSQKMIEPYRASSNSVRSDIRSTFKIVTRSRRPPA